MRDSARAKPCIARFDICDTICCQVRQQLHDLEQRVIEVDAKLIELRQSQSEVRPIALPYRCTPMPVRLRRC
jgi:hypothetical protein